MDALNFLSSPLLAGSAGAPQSTGGLHAQAIASGAGTSNSPMPLGPLGIFSQLVRLH